MSAEVLAYLSNPAAIAENFAKIGNNLSPAGTPKAEWDTLDDETKKYMTTIFEDAVCLPVDVLVNDLNQARERYVNQTILNTSTVILQKLMDKHTAEALKRVDFIDELIDDSVEIASRLIVKVHGAMAVTLKVELGGDWQATAEDDILKAAEDASDEAVEEEADRQFVDELDELIGHGAAGGDVDDD